MPRPRSFIEGTASDMSLSGATRSTSRSARPSSHGVPAKLMSSMKPAQLTSTSARSPDRARTAAAGPADAGREREGLAHAAGELHAVDSGARGFVVVKEALSFPRKRFGARQRRDAAQRAAAIEPAHGEHATDEVPVEHGERLGHGPAVVHGAELSCVELGQIIERARHAGDARASIILGMSHGLRLSCHGLELSHTNA